MKKLALLLCSFAVAAAAQAQSTVVRWNFNDLDATFDSGTPVNFSIGIMTVGNTTTSSIDSSSASSGYTGASGGGNFATRAVTGALSISTSTYYTFTLTPATGYQINASNLSVGSRSTGSGPTTLSLFSSIDNYTTPLSTANTSNGSTWALASLPFTVTGATDQAVTFRLYGSGGAGTIGNGNWRIDDLSLTAQAVPEPSTYAMIGLGAALLLGIQRFRRKSS